MASKGVSKITSVRSARSSTTTAGASFAIYAMGILGDGDRKSVEPYRSRLRGPASSRLGASELHFVSNSRWRDRDVRQVGSTYAIEAISEHSPVEAWIVDDTGMLK